MKIVITQWALDSYLDLKHNNVFNQIEFNTRIKPDVMLLKHYPHDPKFGHGKFWSQANDRSNTVITAGYKMKWHQLGNGKVQLRLPVAVLHQLSFLSGAYVKSNDKFDKRMMCHFKTHIQLIQQNKFITRGVI